MAGKVYLKLQEIIMNRLECSVYCLFSILFWFPLKPVSGKTGASAPVVYKLYTQYTLYRWYCLLSSVNKPFVAMNQSTMIKLYIIQRFR